VAPARDPPTSSTVHARATVGDLLRAADSTASSECCDAGKIPGIFVDNSNHQKRRRQNRDEDQPPVAARFLRLVHLGPGAASTAASRPSFQWIDGAPPTKLFTARKLFTGMPAIKVRPRDIDSRPAPRTATIALEFQGSMTSVRGGHDGPTIGGQQGACGWLNRGRATCVAPARRTR
jgi:hypothetical protein